VIVSDNQDYTRGISASDSFATGFKFGMNCGKSAGQTIFHAHIHLIPKRDGDTSNPRGVVGGVIPERIDYRK
jgi:diadenosine tetraphosphate (Ap4A) HIT family hydrolase